MKLVARLGALVVAVALVGAAVAFRAGREGADVVDGGDGQVLDGAAAVTCPADLPRLCDALAALPGLAVAREGTADVADRAAGTTVDDAWLVPAAWADVVDDARARTPGGRAPLVRSEPVATSPVRVLGHASRVEALAAACGVPTSRLEELELACLGELVDRPWPAPGESSWGRVTVALRSPESTTGLLGAAAIAAAVAGTDFGQTELRDPVTVDALQRFASSVAGDERPGPFGLAGRLRSQGPSFASFVVDVEASLAVQEGEQAAGGELLRGFPAVPPLTARLVVVGDDEDAVDVVATLLVEESAVRALGEEAGWRTGPAGDGTAARPDGASLTALRLAWAESIG